MPLHREQIVRLKQCEQKKYIAAENKSVHCSLGKRVQRLFDTCDLVLYSMTLILKLDQDEMITDVCLANTKIFKLLDTLNSLNHAASQNIPPRMFCLGKSCHHKVCLGNRCQRQPSANHICVLKRLIDT